MPKRVRPAIAAMVFDAYGTIFDVHSLAVLAEALTPRHGQDLARLWRAKQLQYTWLQSLMAGPGRPRDDFQCITALALDYAVAELVLPLNAAEKQRLCDAYRTLAPFADARAALEALAPMPCWILSNGTLAMLEPLVRHAGLESLLQGIMSVDAVDVYKPAPQVYALAVERLGLPAGRIGFVSANCWDAIGARAFGFSSFWINRLGATLDRHGPPPDHVLGTLTELPGLLGR
jgi:2-haloacid dehalogenase